MDKDRKMYEKIICILEKEDTKLTTAELARELRISKRTLYILFPNKAAIINETIDFVFYKFRNSWEKAVGKLLLSDLSRCRCSDFPNNSDVDKLIKFVVKIKNDYPEQQAKIQEKLDELSELIYIYVVENENIRVLTSTEKKVLQMLIQQIFKRLLGEKYLKENGLDFKETVTSLFRMIFFGIKY
ncbi:TetR/AcrR family transcriptional regulator [Liquorilactobacillus mali]|nr:TetR/AcrR family transcriptional regulator [Liquorilactobacillus mali]EJE99944.1 transcriptional regulator [Liquorilactobacillus mali KCTC 3596 = DSM 20444]MDC7954143.1 TetR/AcrR family transcriptional regulator [Liquorilactobacillus mali]MDV7757695.1 TetR family transcriptional regulator [Liquorilactobacillus mali]QFQ73770.1 TetR/AcrR family transcriptional regulator [Liquorilactobacillus mali]